MAEPTPAPSPSHPARPATYPPERHALRDLDVTTEHVTAERSVSVAPVDGPVRNAAGAASVGFLAALFDTNAGLMALIAGRPEWTATLDLGLHATGWLTEGPAVLAGRLVRAGSNIVVIGADVYDGRGMALDELVGLDQLAGRDPARLDRAGDEGRLRHVARGIATFTRIPARASAASGNLDPLGLVGTRRNLGPMVAPDPVPLAERIGLRAVDAPNGVVELHNHPYVQNSFGALNGGVLGMVFQAAAEGAVPDMVATDLQVHYLSQAKVGPARTDFEVLRTVDDHALCSVRLVDAGNDDVVLALATVTLQPPPLGTPSSTS
jgi:acyl-coenzyme A thioesterase PaaI-like protein